MDPDLSEFSYGFALTSELIEKFKLKRAGAPEFATQHAESKKGGGWDMKLPGLPVFLQFKRSDKMVRSIAQEAHLIPGLPFFRMHLRRRSYSNQHQLMLDLEGAGNVVLYAAPKFSTSLELNVAFVSGNVARSSIFIRPSKIGPLLDDKAHWVAFHKDKEPAYFCSTPREIELELPATLFGEVLPARAAQQPKRSSEEFFRGISEELLRIYHEHTPDVEVSQSRISEAADRRGAQEIAGLVARTLFDCELLVYPQGSASDSTSAHSE